MVPFLATVLMFLSNAATQPPTNNQGASLPIELVVASRYQLNSGKFYLINSAEPPVTLFDVDRYLEQHKGKWQRVDIIIYTNSVDAEHYSVLQLRRLLEQEKMPWHIPPAYHTKRKQ